MTTKIRWLPLTTESNSSREIQWCCETNIIFKALSCDTVPHFPTLAKFVSQHADEIEELFEPVLLVCHEQGLTGGA
jgi:transposase